MTKFFKKINEINVDIKKYIEELQDNIGEITIWNLITNLERIEQISCELEDLQITLEDEAFDAEKNYQGEQNND